MIWGGIILLTFYRKYPTSLGLLLGAVIIWTALLISDQTFLIYRRDVGSDRAFGTQCIYFGGAKTYSAVRVFLNPDAQRTFSCPATKLASQDLSQPVIGKFQ